jgi:hypothetical protein
VSSVSLASVGLRYKKVPPCACALSLRPPFLSADDDVGGATGWRVTGVLFGVRVGRLAADTQCLHIAPALTARIQTLNFLGGLGSMGFMHGIELAAGSWQNPCRFVSKVRNGIDIIGGKGWPPGL